LKLQINLRKLHYIGIEIISEMQKNNLTPLQVHFIQVLGQWNLKDEELNEIKALVSKHFAEKADKLMVKIWDEKKISTKDLDTLLEG